jgi:hypothetical protein
LRQLSAAVAQAALRREEDTTSTLGEQLQESDGRVRALTKELDGLRANLTGASRPVQRGSRWSGSEPPDLGLNFFKLSAGAADSAAAERAASFEATVAALKVRTLSYPYLVVISIRTAPRVARRRRSRRS